MPVVAMANPEIGITMTVCPNSGGAMINRTCVLLVPLFPTKFPLHSILAPGNLGCRSCRMFCNLSWHLLFLLNFSSVFAMSGLLTSYHVKAVLYLHSQPNSSTSCKGTCSPPLQSPRIVRHEDPSTLSPKSLLH